MDKSLRCFICGEMITVPYYTDIEEKGRAHLICLTEAKMKIKIENPIFGADFKARLEKNIERKVKDVVKQIEQELKAELRPEPVSLADDDELTFLSEPDPRLAMFEGLIHTNNCSDEGGWFAFLTPNGSAQNFDESRRIGLYVNGCDTEEEAVRRLITFAYVTIRNLLGGSNAERH